MPQAVDDCAQSPTAHLSDFGEVIDGASIQQGLAGPENLTVARIEFAKCHRVVPFTLKEQDAGTIIDLLGTGQHPQRLRLSASAGVLLFLGLSQCRVDIGLVPIKARAELDWLRQAT